MNLLILVSFIGFTVLVGALTWFFTRGDDHGSSQGYFLGGRKLTFPLIAGSLLLTNLSTEQMVGLNGAAFTDGLSVMAWEVVAVVALVLMALFFLPRFLRSGITTVPQFLEIRFDRSTMLVTNFIFLVAYAFLLLPIILYTGATGLMGMLDVGSLTGIQNDTTNLYLMVWVVGIIGSVYALFGGLRTVAVSDTINGIGLLIGGLLISYFGLKMVSDGGGILQGWDILRAASPERFHSAGQPGQSVPFSTLFTGVLLLNLFYWCTNQQIIQRTLGARSLAEGQKGVLLTGALKMLGPIYLVLPGIIAYYLFAAQEIKADHAYGMLVRTVLPSPLTGIFAAVMVGAILSSFNSALNSTCTLFSLGLYKTLLKPEVRDEQLINVSKYFGWGIAILAMLIAPLLASTGSIFGYLQKMNGIYFIPIFSVVVMGMLNKRVPPMAAKTALCLGFSLIAGGYFIPGVSDWVSAIHEFHFLGAVFALLCAVMLLFGQVKPLPAAWVQEDSQAVDLTAWKWSKLTGGLLLLAVISIYVLFI